MHALVLPTLGDFLKEYILGSDAPDCLKAPEAADYWFDYIKPVLKSLQKEKYRVSTLIAL